MKKFDIVSNFSKNIFVAILLFIVVIIGSLFFIHGYEVSVLWPATGFSVGFYLISNRKLLPGIALGLFVGNLVMRFIIFDYSFVDGIVLVIGFSFLTLLEAEFFYSIKRIFIADNKMDIYAIGKYLGLTIVTALVGSVFSSILISVLYNDISSISTTFINWFIGDFFGIAIFASSIHLSSLYDKLYIRRNAYFGSMFVVIYISLIYFMLTDSMPFFVSNSHSYIFSLFFIIVPIVFNFRMTSILSLIYITMFYIFGECTNCGSDGSLIYLLLNVNVFLSTMLLISIVVKIFFVNHESLNTELQLKNIQLENLINSTNELLSMSDEIVSLKAKREDEYIKKIFRLALKLFTKIDYATCYIYDKKPVFIDAFGYDLEYINSLSDNFKTFNYKFEKPYLRKNSEKEMELSLGKKIYEDYSQRSPVIKESIFISVFLKNGIVGGMSFDLDYYNPKGFTNSDLSQFDSFQKLMNSFYTINALNIKANNLKNDIVLALIKTLDLYDKYTKGHSEDVAYISRDFGKRLNLNSDELHDLFWAGIVHDIGKVGVKEEIVNKTTRLTADEYEEIKMHPIYGFNVLEQIDDLNHIGKVVRHHHERFDGDGYPDHIKGEEIPYLARVITVVDSVSSMITDRIYRPKLKKEEVLKELKVNKGLQFDPDIAEEMIKYIKEGKLDHFYLTKDI
ncbi:hypothetical protein CI105_03960 [Candidatus Izimaplasma bacterium ZiA1]|uniref:HD domain-containing phosphohydrolase n=1 Tax=Candidatus Izimoplasma sp. ZiA1 TaxID=2024899 RepID=UPI000BAA92C6|nr:hypothetical protein CI105_03960 [Candidatus Izimaplasma bacterium ZiA1]